MTFWRLFDKNIAKIAPVAFIVLTLVFSFLRIPFYDEAHAYIISQFDLSEIFYLTRIEGHPILWYLILKPFNNINFYPYSLTLINWVFSSVMIFVFWKKAPFNNLIKFLLTFSYPFFQYFGVISRPYTLAVLVIFLITSFYKDSLKKPILYSILLVLCANISVVSLFISGAFFLLFLYEIYKTKCLSKKQLIDVCLVFFIGFILFISQFLFVEAPKMQTDNAHLIFLKNLLSYTIAPFLGIQSKNINQILLQFVSAFSVFYFSYILFKKSKKAFFITYCSIIPMIIMFLFIYVGNFWHYYFILIAFLCGFWIDWDKFKNDKILNCLLIGLILLNMSSYSLTKNGKNETNQPIFYKKAYEIISKNPKYKNSKLFCFNYYSYLAPGLLVYLKKDNIFFFDNHNNNLLSFEFVKNLQNVDYKTIEPSEFIKYLDKNKDNYLFATSNKIADYNNFSFGDDKYKINLNLVEYHPELYLLIYKITYSEINKS